MKNLFNLDSFTKDDVLEVINLAKNRGKAEKLLEKNE